MAPPYISVPDLQHYDGTFSFVTSRLHANITRALPTYDEIDPKTWPYVTLATIERDTPYQGYPDLPTGVAYERQVLERYEAMYSALQRASTIEINGAFHQRYPFNFDRFEVPKDEVGVSSVEYRAYMGDTTAVRDETTGSKPPSRSGPKEERNTCGNKKCVETRRELAKLRGKLFDKESQLLSSQADLKEYEATEILKRNTLADAEFQLDKEKQRAEAAEQDGMLRMKGRIRLLKRIGVLENKVAEINDLEQYITELERENVMLKGLGKSAKGKRMLAEMELDSDQDMEDAVRAGKRIVLEEEESD